jgi:Outer membrane protein beta-barrel domain
MSRSPALALLFAFVALAPKAALAADCPDGWFCEDGAPPQAPPPPNAPPGEHPGPRQPPAPPDGVEPFTPPPYPPPGAPDEPTIFVDRPENAPPPAAVHRHRRQFHEWGFNLHLEGAIIGNKPGRASNAGMGGLGFGFRYRPLPPLAFEAGIDLLSGTDFNGYSRSEAGLLLNTLVFFNPHDVVQVYALGGIGFSAADVTVAQQSGQNPFPQHNETYSYFGGQAGLGIEVRVMRGVALGGDILGLIRGRTDNKANYAPEFEDPNTHRVTNTSGAGLIRVGVTFYW